MIVSRVADVLRDVGFRPRGIVHVGAHKGQEAERYLELGPELIVWIDAEQKWMPRLRKRALSSGGITRQLVLQALITDRDGEPVRFFRYSNKGLSSSVFRSTSVMKEAWPGVVETGEVAELVSARLDTTLAAAGVQPSDVDVLIFDIQGAELMALKGAGAYLASAEFVEVEVSQAQVYDGAPLADQVESFLTEAGFRRMTRLKWHGDVVFRRDHAAA